MAVTHPNNARVARGEYLLTGALAVALLALALRQCAIDGELDALKSSAQTPEAPEAHLTSVGGTASGPDERVLVRDTEQTLPGPEPEAERSPEDDRELTEEERTGLRAQKILEQLDEDGLARWWEARFERDAIDPEWVRTGDELILPAVRAALPAGSTLERFACRGGYCRVETRHASVDSQNQFAFALFPVRAGDAALVKLGCGFTMGEQSIEPDGSTHAVMFVARKGSLLVPH